jgi:hypothetical protein
LRCWSSWRRLDLQTYGGSSIQLGADSSEVELLANQHKLNTIVAPQQRQPRLKAMASRRD